MSNLGFGEFKRILEELNPDLRVFPSRTTRSSMIYLRGSFDPVAGTTDTGLEGLNPVLAFPSPSHGSFPKYDFVDQGGLPGRGYTTVFKMLVKRRLLDKDRLRALLPQALDPSRGRPVRKEKTDAPPPVPVYAAEPRATKLRITARKPRPD